MKAIKPMLAEAAQIEDVRYPVLVSPKVDGVRALIVDGVVQSRSGKPIKNKWVQKQFGQHRYNGMDGELVCGSPIDPNVMQKTMSAVNSIEGEPDVKFMVFDKWDYTDTNERAPGYGERLWKLQSQVDYNFTWHGGKVLLLPQWLVKERDRLEELESELLAQGYEGIIVRDPESPYKHGRSTLAQGWMLKIKRFSDAEAEVIGYDELMKNTAPEERNSLGYIERSTSKQFQIGMDTLGSLRARTPEGVEFSIGSGFTQFQRKHLWLHREKLIGKLVKYKHFEQGVVDAPRFPIFIGFRDESDL